MHGRAKRALREIRGARRLPLTRSVLAVVLAALIWVGFAPPQIGGSTAYVITYGISMLPRFHAGDLVVLRKEPSYHVGEVAAYHNGQLGVVVMHRIVAIEGRHYVFKGDNNSFFDSFHPVRSQIVGAEWLHVPWVGTLLKDVRKPLVAAIGLGVLWIVTFYPRSRSRREKRRHRHASRA